MSMLEALRAMRETGNTNPPITMWLPWLTMVVCHLAPGDWITNGVDILSKGISWLRAKLSDMKECDAPESKRTEAGIELTRRVPITILGSCRASSMLTWLT